MKAAVARRPLVNPVASIVYDPAVSATLVGRVTVVEKAPVASTTALPTSVGEPPVLVSAPIVTISLAWNAPPLTATGGQ
jgi:hypothetical protein